jgi:hypothetical protein
MDEIKYRKIMEMVKEANENHSAIAGELSDLNDTMDDIREILKSLVDKYEVKENG